MDKKRHQKTAAPVSGEKKIVPVLEEEVEVRKRAIETGVTRVTKKVHEKEKVIDEPLLQEEVEVERVPVNRFVEQPLPVRQEDGVTIVPLLEEVAVVEKRLLLKEELHIRKKPGTVRKPQTVVLRSEEAVVEHSDLRGQEEDEAQYSKERRRP